MQKRVYYFARVHVDATWHSGPHGSATRAHAAPTWRLSGKVTCAIIYIYILHII